MIGPKRSKAKRPLARDDVVLVPFPFTDLTTTKRRPAVVVCADAAQEDFTLAFVTSQDVQLPDASDVVVLPSHPEFGLTGLAVASRIRATKMVTLNRALIARWLGRLGSLLAADLDHALITALGINTVPFHEGGRHEERRRLVALYDAGGAASVLADLALPTR